jgi:hypothetical protein
VGGQHADNNGKLTEIRKMKAEKRRPSLKKNGLQSIDIKNIAQGTKKR